MYLTTLEPCYLLFPFWTERYAYVLSMLHSHVRLFATLRTTACQAPLSTGFSRQEYWSGLPCPSPGDLPYYLSYQGSPRILKWVAYPFSRGNFWPRNWTGVSCIAGRFFISWAAQEAHFHIMLSYFSHVRLCATP